MARRLRQVHEVVADPDGAGFQAGDTEQGGERRQQAVGVVSCCTDSVAHLVDIVASAVASSACRKRVSGVRRSCAMLSPTCRMSLIRASMRSSISLSVGGLVVLVPRAPGRYALAEVAVNDTSRRFVDILDSTEDSTARDTPPTIASAVMRPALQITPPASVGGLFRSEMSRPTSDTRPSRSCSTVLVPSSAGRSIRAGSGTSPPRSRRATAMPRGCPRAVEVDCRRHVDHFGIVAGTIRSPMTRLSPFRPWVL